MVTLYYVEKGRSKLIECGRYGSVQQAINQLDNNPGLNYYVRLGNRMRVVSRLRGEDFLLDVLGGRVMVSDCGNYVR